MKGNAATIEETLEQNEDDEDVTKDDDDGSMNTNSDTNFPEDDVNMTQDGANSKPIIKQDESEATKLNNDSSLDDVMKNEGIASFSKDSNADQNDYGSDATSSGWDTEEKPSSLEMNSKINRLFNMLPSYKLVVSGR